MSQKAILRLSLSYRVTLFFARHPDEELTCEDVVTKFSDAGVDIANVYRHLQSNVTLGLLERERMTCAGAATYRAGATLLQEIGAARSAPKRAEPIAPSPYAEALDRTGISTQSASRYQALANVPVATELAWLA